MGCSGDGGHRGGAASAEEKEGENGDDKRRSGDPYSQSNFAAEREAGVGIVRGGGSGVGGRCGGFSDRGFRVGGSGVKIAIAVADNDSCGPDDVIFWDKRRSWGRVDAEQILVEDDWRGRRAD